VPDKNKIAVIPKHQASTNKDVTVKELRVLDNGEAHVGDLTAEKVRVENKGQFYASTVTVSEDFTFTGGLVCAQVDIPPDATLLIDGTDKKEVNGRLGVRGKGILNFKGGHLSLFNDGLEVEMTGVLEVREEGKFDGHAPVRNSGRLEIAAPMHLLDGVHLKNSDLGTLQITIPDETSAQSPRIMLEKDNSCYLDGKLVLVLGFQAAVGASVQVLSYPEYHCTGSFAAIESSPNPWHWQANYGNTGLSVQRV
jgi:hypothetical protein